MPTLFAVFNLKEKQMAEEYDNYLTNTKIPGIRGAPWCTAFHTWRIDTARAVRDKRRIELTRIEASVVINRRSLFSPPLLRRTGRELEVTGAIQI